MDQNVKVKVNMPNGTYYSIQTERDTKLSDVLVSTFKYNQGLINKYVGEKLVLSSVNKLDRQLTQINQADLEKNIGQFGKEGATSFTFSFRVARQNDKTVINLNLLKGIEINNKQEIKEESQKEKKKTRTIMNMNKKKVLKLM